MLKRLILSLFLIGAGSAGIAAPASALTFDLSKLQQAAGADLVTAKADADAHGDVFASQCYAGLLAFASKHPAQNLVPNINGVASAFQAGRDVVKGVEGAAGSGAIPSDLVLACGPLALDVQNDIAKATVGGINIFGLHL